MSNVIIAKVQMGANAKGGQSVRAYEAVTGMDITKEIVYATLKNAFDAGNWLENSAGKWKQVSIADASKVGCLCI